MQRISLTVISRSAGLLLLVGVLLVIGGGVAWTSHIDNMVPTINYDKSCAEGSVSGGGTVCQTDNSTVSYYMTSSGSFALESDDKQDVQQVLANQYAPTDLTVNYDSTPTYSGSGETDIIYQEGDVPGANTGRTWCNDDSLAPKYICDQQYVRIEAGGAYTPGLTCHETGHAVGLVHGPDSYPAVALNHPDIGCMKKPTPVNEGLGGNQISNINNLY
jgi:hypothetical protein